MSRLGRVLACALFILLAAASCDIDVAAPDMVGEWGGEHILLSLTLDGGTLEYDCAHGTIEETIVPDRSGNFVVSGIHVREHGGPISEDEIPDEHPARYVGWTNGRSMTLSVTLTDSGDSLGTYELRLGEQARLFKCL
jgi:hypothetical protein